MKESDGLHVQWSVSESYVFLEVGTCLMSFFHVTASNKGNARSYFLGIAIGSMEERSVSRKPTLYSFALQSMAIPLS